MDPFVSTMLIAYVKCALWAEMDESDDATGGDPLDRNYTMDNIAEEAMIRLREDCEEFLREVGADLYGQFSASFLGHNLWLTRNLHGTGFWDRGIGKAGDTMSEIAQRLGQRDIYVGDDGLLYVI